MGISGSRTYDYVYLTNTPSFYKLNLCDKLGEAGLKGLLVFYGYGGEAVNVALNDASKWHFDFQFLHNGDSHRRSFFSTFMSLRRLMRTVECKKVLFSGWLANEYNLYSLFSPRRKNVVVVESTICESQVSGLKGWIKKRILRRMSSALPSGMRHTELLTELGFKGRMTETGSVGILNKPNRVLKAKSYPEEFRYLYVGRLIDCKNLEFIINCFNASGRKLTIVGAGELDRKLRNMAGPNIKFLGFIDNGQLKDIYSSHDIFLLPSKSEPWGLVVEEAIYFGMPVIVSNNVGSGPEMVETLGTGLVFTFNDAADFEAKCLEMERNYAKFAEASAAVDFDDRERQQIKAYIDTING